MIFIKRLQDLFIISLLAVIVVLIGCGKKEKPLSVMPWEDNKYVYYEDTALLRLIDANDTLAAMTLTWHYINRDENIKAANLIADFNKFHSNSTPELNYITGMALAGRGADSAALVYLEPLRKSKRIPQARYLLASTYKKLGRYEDAIEIYKKLPDKKSEAIKDSILICKAEMGDTISAITYAQKMLRNREIGTAAKYFERYVSKQRGKSPAEWNYGAGEAYFEGNNFTRAQVFLENADAEIDDARLSNLLGRTYLKLEVFDSCASKLNQALLMGDSSLDNVHTLLLAQSREDNEEEVFHISELGRSLFPEDERFYYYDSQILYKQKKYQELLDLATEGMKHLPYSYRIYSYLIGSQYLMGNKHVSDSLVNVYVEKFKYQPFAMKEIAQFFKKSLNDTATAERLQKLEISDKFPSIAGFYTQYDLRLTYNEREIALSMLNEWIELDTVAERIKIIEYLKERDFPEEE